MTGSQEDPAALLHTPQITILLAPHNKLYISKSPVRKRNRMKQETNVWWRPTHRHTNAHLMPTSPFIKILLRIWTSAVQYLEGLCGKTLLCVCVWDMKTTCVLRPSDTVWNNIKTKSGRKLQPKYIQTNRTAPGLLTQWGAYMTIIH